MRNSYTNEIYQMRGIAGVAGQASRSDLAGKLRLKRTGTVLEGYYWDGTAFVLLGSSPTPTDDTRLMVDFSSPTDALLLSPPGVAIALDNFKVNAGTASICQ